MMKNLLAAAAAVVALTLGGTAISQSQFGTAAEAKAMLEKAVTALKADKGKALTAFQAGTDGFKDRDLYVFCAGDDGIITAHPTIKGQQIRDLVDKTGNKLGLAIVAAAKEGQVNQVEYMWPRPGADTTPVKKFTYVTKVGDQTCGVGYYQA